MNFQHVPVGNGAFEVAWICFAHIPEVSAAHWSGQGRNGNVCRFAPHSHILTIRWPSPPANFIGP